VLLAVVTLLGTIGFVEIEGWELWRAFYFTIITITTVGYGDEGLSDPGKRFATLVLSGGSPRPRTPSPRSSRPRSPASSPGASA